MATARRVFDRVKETTTSTGTGNLALAGAVASFITFASVFDDSELFPYSIDAGNGVDWEIGFGQLSGANLVRTLVTASSNSGNPVNFGAGTKTVYNTFTALTALNPLATLFGDARMGSSSPSSGSDSTSFERHYDSYTPTGTSALDFSNQRLLFRGTLDLANAPANALHINGPAAGAQPNAGTAAASATFTGGGSGGSGGKGSTSPNGQAGTTVARGNGGAGGAGGKAGAPETSTGGAGGSVSNSWTMPEWSPLGLGVGGGAGGGGGGGDDSTVSRDGGGGGAGAGVGMIIAKTINRGVSTTAGAISARGGNGAAGMNAAGGSNSGGLGGGGGAGGGWLIIAYFELTGSAKTGLINASGGSGGNGGTADGTGTGGTGGTGARAGRVTLINLKTGEITDSGWPGAAGSAGSNGSGTTGGAGGAGGVLAVDL